MVETLILAGVIDRIQAPGEMKHVTPNRHSRRRRDPATCGRERPGADHVQRSAAIGHGRGLDVAGANGTSTGRTETRTAGRQALYSLARSRGHSPVASSALSSRRMIRAAPERLPLCAVGGLIWGGIGAGIGLVVKTLRGHLSPPAP